MIRWRGEFGEDRRQPMSCLGVHAEFVVAATEVLHERVTGTDHARRAEPFQPAHGVESRLEPTVICLNRIIPVLLDDVALGGQHVVEHARVSRGSVGAHLDRARAVCQGAGEEPASSREIPLLGPQHVDDLPELIDRPVQIDPVGLEYRILGLTWGFAVPGSIMLRSDTRW